MVGWTTASTTARLKIHHGVDMLEFFNIPDQTGTIFCFQ